MICGKLSIVLTRAQTQVFFLLPCLDYSSVVASAHLGIAKMQSSFCIIDTVNSHEITQFVAETDVWEAALDRSSPPVRPAFGHIMDNLVWADVYVRV